jgi:CRISPR type III-A-associated protein Csm2
MNKTCEICNIKIENPKFSMCKSCNESKRLPDNLKIKGSFYENGHLKEAVFKDVPEKLAKLFQKGNLGMNKLRAFFSMVRTAYEMYAMSHNKDFNSIKPQLWKIVVVVEDRTRRNVTPPSFLEFIKDGIKIAENDNTGKELQGFVELFRSVLAYSK